MASEQLSRRDNKGNEREVHVEKERVPQLASHFEAIAVQQGKPTDQHIAVKPTITEKTEHSQRSSGISKVRDDEKKHIIEGQKPEETHELAEQFESLADQVRDKRETRTDRQARVGEEQRYSKQRNEGQVGSRQNQPSLEEISNYRALAQDKSNEAIRAAKERYGEEQRISEKQQRDSKQRNEGQIGSHQNQPSNYRASAQEKSNEAIAKERYDEEEEAGEQRHSTEQQAGLETVKETLTSAAKTAKEYTAPIAEKAKDYTVTAGQTTAQFLGQKAAAAKDVAVESGKVAAEYAGKAAEDLKDKAVVAGWSTAHYSCETAVEGTKAAARLVKGAAGYAGAMAAKPLGAAKNVAESAGENVKEYTERKKEEAQRESMYKEGEKESFYEEHKESFEGGKKEQVKERDDGDGDGDGGGILGAIGETIYEIAQTTKEIVIGGDGTVKQRSLGFELGQEEEVERGHGHEHQQGYYQTETRKETRA